LNSASSYYKGSEDLIKGFHHLFAKQEQKISLHSLTPSNWRTPQAVVGCDLQFAVSFTSGTVLLKPNTRNKQLVATFDTDATDFVMVISSSSEVFFMNVVIYHAHRSILGKEF
jgi:hypothetical protein